MGSICAARSSSHGMSAWSVPEYFKISLAISNNNIYFFNTNKATSLIFLQAASGSPVVAVVGGWVTKRQERVTNNATSLIFVDLRALIRRAIKN